MIKLTPPNLPNQQQQHCHMLLMNSEGSHGRVNLNTIFRLTSITVISNGLCGVVLQQVSSEFVVSVAK